MVVAPGHGKLCGDAADLKWVRSGTDNEDIGRSHVSPGADATDATQVKHCDDGKDTNFEESRTMVGNPRWPKECKAVDASKCTESRADDLMSGHEKVRESAGSSICVKSETVKLNTKPRHDKPSADTTDATQAKHRDNKTTRCEKSRAEIAD